MSSKKKVEKILDKYSVEEILEDPSIDMMPFVEYFLEELGSESEDDVNDFVDALGEAITAAEVDEDDQELVWNRVAYLLVMGLAEEVDDEDLELYTGLEGQVAVLAGLAFSAKLEEYDEPNDALLLPLHIYFRDFLEVIWNETEDPEMGAELLWQAEEACLIYANNEKYEDCLETASAALDIYDEIEDEDVEGMREAVGLLWYYMGEGEEDDDTAEEYYRNAIEALDDPSVLDDPVDEETPELLQQLKEDLGDEDDEEDDEDDEE